MRILFFSHYFFPEENAPATRTLENARRWVEAGESVRVVTGAPNVPDGVVYDGYRNRWRFEETVQGIEVSRVWTVLAPNKGTVRRILNYLSYLVTATLRGLGGKRPDVVIATSPQFFCGWAGVLVSRLRRVPFILEIRDIWPESIEAVGAMGAMGGRGTMGVLSVLERAMYRAADHIVCVGPGYRDKLVERGVPPEKISIVTNGIDTPRSPVAGQSEDLRRRHRPGAGHFVVTYAGTIGMACGLDVVLRAAERLRDDGDDRFRFILVGDGAVREELEQDARRRDLDTVVFTGRVPKSEAAEYLEASDAVLVHLRDTPLFRTVIPSKMFDAFAAARPVVMGVGGHAAGILGESGAGYVFEPDEESGLIDRLDRLERDRERAVRMGIAGLRFAAFWFDRDRLAAAYLQKVREVATARIPETSPAVPRAGAKSR